MSESNSRSRARKIRVAVLFGGQSEEHDVSLRSAQTVMNALDSERFDAVPFGITRDGQWITSGDPMAQLTAMSPLFSLTPAAQSTLLDSSNTDVSGAHLLPADLAETIDVVFPVLHGPRGEDGTVQGLLELAGVPYVGSGVLGSAVAMDKAMAKVVLGHHGVRQAPWLLVNREEWLRSPAIVQGRIATELGFPCFTKPANMGSSVGVSKVSSPAELDTAMRLAARLDRRIVVEKGIDAREIEISVLGNENPITSCLGEVVSANEFYDYESKYIDERSQLLVPADVPEKVIEEAGEMALTAFRALDLAGLARVDFLLERKTMTLFLNEVNTLPGFTSISMYPMLWEASGMNIMELVQRLIELALERGGESSELVGTGTAKGTDVNP
ncbi:D-alanine--D-alanine ligase family protein [soil metagenome]